MYRRDHWCPGVPVRRLQTSRGAADLSYPPPTVSGLREMPQDLPPLPYYGHPGRGLAFCSSVASDAAPRYLESNVIVPIRTIGIEGKTSLKASFWHSTARRPFSSAIQTSSALP